jgi:magnesium and cobalt transporter
MPKQPGRFRIRALTSLEQFNESFQTELFDEQVETIGGYVTDHFGRLPHRGETIELDGFRFEVQRADARQLHVLIAERLPQSAAE